MNCGAYYCRHNYDYGRCNKSTVAIDKEGKCTLFDDIKEHIHYIPKHNEMDEHTNMC